jgi:esterase/lipase
MHANEIILHGHREPIVLLHGLYSSALEWQFIAKKFHEAGHTVIVPHLEGYSVGNACKMNKKTDF